MQGNHSVTILDITINTGDNDVDDNEIDDDESHVGETDDRDHGGDDKYHQ